MSEDLERPSDTPTEITTPSVGAESSPGERPPDDEYPVWRTALEVSLERGYISEFELRRVYAAAAERRDSEDLRKLLVRALSVYQERRGQIEDLFLTLDQKWAVIRTVRRWPSWRPVVLRSSTVDTVFDIEKARPAELGQVFTELTDLTVTAANTLRATDQLSFANEVNYAFQTVVAEVYDANGEEVPSDDVTFMQGEVVRLREMWVSAAARGVPITTLEGMGIGTAAIILVSSIVAWILTGAHISAFRASTFVGVSVAGALGAVISVLTRMSAGTFRVPVETARTNVRVLAAIRPFVGAAFGVVVVFGLLGQLLGLQTVVSSDRSFYAYFVFAFVGGFSERWSRNLLAGVAGRLDASVGSPETDEHSSTAGMTGSPRPDEPVS